TSPGGYYEFLQYDFVGCNGPAQGRTLKKALPGSKAKWIETSTAALEAKNLCCKGAINVLGLG
ncbi:MAG: hypothetical protein QMD09_10770, partial [Desulfatibacillaceae bacterium]|nr:hypothetical protein [Desulfatibacillaceae bacterium]